MPHQVNQHGDTYPQQQIDLFMETSIPRPLWSNSAGIVIEERQNCVVKDEITASATMDGFGRYPLWVV